MKYLLLLTILFLAGCSQVQPKMPQEPAQETLGVELQGKTIVFETFDDQQVAIKLLQDGLQKGYTGNLTDYSGGVADGKLFKDLYAEMEKNMPTKEKDEMIVLVKTVSEDAEILGANVAKKDVKKQIYKNYKTKKQVIDLVKNAPLR